MRTLLKIKKVSEMVPNDSKGVNIKVGYLRKRV